MQAILLQKDDELFFIKKQKSILLGLNGDASPAVALPLYPLHICLESQNSDVHPTLAQLKNNITKVTVQSPALHENQLYWPVTITFKDGTTAAEKMIFATVKKEIPELSEDFSKELKIFRLADIKKTGFVFEIQKPVWCKIKS